MNGDMELLGIGLGAHFVIQRRSGGTVNVLIESIAWSAHGIPAVLHCLHGTEPLSIPWHAVEGFWPIQPKETSEHGPR